VGESSYFLGIDGGGTGCRARLADVSGRILGEGKSGPANLALGVQLAVDSVMAATREALACAQLNETHLSMTHAGLGMAAGNVSKHRQALEHTVLPFLSVSVCSDAETACMGAHGGRDGGILILGTGSQGIVSRNGTFATVGGWGFAVSDSGSGAILGRATVRRAVLAHEGIESSSPLTVEVMRQFDSNLAKMLEWAELARPRDWGTFARLVFDHAEKGDPVAQALVQCNADAAMLLLDRMVALGAERISLMGGLAEPTRPFLASRFDSLIVAPQGDALAGALLLARRRAGIPGTS
jgi:glucosamine kinase